MPVSLGFLSRIINVQWGAAGNYALVGRGLAFDFDERCYTLFLAPSDGATVWTGREGPVFPLSVAMDRDRNVIVSGLQRTGAFAAPFVSGFNLVKFDQDGVKVWEKFFDDVTISLPHENEVIPYIAVDGEGNVFAAVTMEQGGSAEDLFKLSPAGTEQWHVVFDETLEAVPAGQMRCNSEGDLWSATFLSSAVAVTKFSSASGAALQTISIPSAVSASVCAVDQLDNIIVASFTGVLTGGTIRKYSPEGNLLWQVAGDNADVDSQNNVFLVGGTDIKKLTPDGEPVWQEPVAGYVGLVFQVPGIAVSGDGSFLITYNDSEEFHHYASYSADGERVWDMIPSFDIISGIARAFR